MQFTDIKFIFIFLPIFIILYYIIKPIQKKNKLICYSSLIYYFLGTIYKPYYILLLFFCTLITYLSALFIEKKKSKRKFFLIITLIIDFGILLAFKYSALACRVFNSALKCNIPELNLILPLGLSFYTFEAAAYTIDVYKGTVKPQKNIIMFFTYLSMFSQLSSGPITLYQTIEPQLLQRHTNFSDLNEGLKLFVCGLGLKVILANNIGGIWRDALKIGLDCISTPYAWACSIGFSFKLYFDFYGYSLMAKGLARIMGFEIPDNFNSPYFSKNFTEFWRKWHMSLSNWFKNYIYIPLGGSKHGIVRTIFSLLIVWLLTGIWHGSTFNYLLWAMLIFLLIIIEKAGLKKYTEKYKILGHLYMILFIPVTWSVFAITDLNILKSFIPKLFFVSDNSLFCLDYKEFITHYGLLFIFAILLSTPLDKILYKKFKNTFIGSIVLGTVFAVSIFFIFMGQNDPFMYFRF